MKQIKLNALHGVVNVEAQFLKVGNHHINGVLILIFVAESLLFNLR